MRYLEDKAFPELQDEARGTISLVHCLSQLESQQMSSAVRQHKLQTIREAGTATLEFEVYFLASDTNQREDQPLATADNPLH